MFWLALAAKMAVAAASVVTASLVAERAGSFVGALVATLPISAGPAYVFLALDHDAAFIAASALASLAVNAGTTLFALTYILLAQTRGTVTSLVGSLAAWFAITALVQSAQWNLIGAVAANIAAYLFCMPIAHRFRAAHIRPAARRWYDVPLRASLVAVLVATVVTASAHVGPVVTGTLALFPIVLTSLIVILQPRIGGPATAALFANSIIGLIGFGLALLVVTLAAVPLGSGVALALGLATSVGWNLVLWVASRRARRA